MSKAVPAMDDVLRRILETPPTSLKSVKPKQVQATVQKKKPA